MSNADACYARCEGVVSTPIPGGETVLLSLETQRYYTLNETGAWLWEHLAKPQPAGALAGALAETYDVDSETARDSVEALLDDLQREELVVMT